MAAVPDLAELQSTVARMERHYVSHPLFADYKRLCERFAKDLRDPRDVAMSQAAGLMLMKFASERLSNS